MANRANSKREKVAQTHDLIYTSYHEAGHTIFGLLHLMRVECVHVYFEKEVESFGGYTHYNFPDIENFQDRNIQLYIINSEIGIKYAGLTAEKYQFKISCGSDKLPVFIKDGSSDDTMAAARLFQQHKVVAPGKKRYLYKKRLIKNTLKELRIYWSDVTLVAHSLFKNKRIYFSDLKKILTTKSENKEFWRAQLKTLEYLYKNHDKLDENDFRIMLIKRGLL
jgi:hypothetical protein